MSGIAGHLRFDGGPASLTRVQSMAETMPHRGPDGKTTWSDGGAALAQMAMHTTTQAATTHLPLHSPDGALSLVIDGRVDNWEDLRDRLADSGARLRSASDAELILQAYQMWGAGCLDAIEGDFAFVLWDARERLAFCARDRMGQKPFFYHWDGTRLLFASELRPVADALDSPPPLNTGVIAEMLDNQWISRSETLWQGIARLTPGHYMIVNANGPTETRYWHPENTPLLRLKTDADYVEQYRHTLTDVVRRVSRSHTTVGYDVSGGLDSSSIFATAHRLTERGQLPAPDILGFTLRFATDTDAYELDYAHAVGAHTGRPITEVDPTLASLAWYQDDTRHSRTVASLPNGLMHASTYHALHHRGGRAYLNGLGGDQWLAFGDNALAETVQCGDWAHARQVLRADRDAFGGPIALYRAIRHGVYPLLPEAMRAAARQIAPIKPEGHEPQSWLSDGLQQELADRRATADAARRQRTKGLRIGLRQRLMSVDSAYLQFGCELLDVMGQKAGVEVRSPFLNRTFVEMCLSLPMTQLQRGETDRFIHRSAMVGTLPEKVRTRADKAEFSAAFEPILQELSKAPEPEEATHWLAPGTYQDVQTAARDPESARYAWPAGILLLLHLITQLTRSPQTDPPQTEAMPTDDHELV